MSEQWCIGLKFSLVVFFLTKVAKRNFKLERFYYRSTRSDIDFLVKKNGLRNYSKVLDSIIESYAKVSGAKVYLSRFSNEILQKASEASKKHGDQFVSLGFLLIRLFLARGELRAVGATTLSEFQTFFEKDEALK